MSEQSLEISKLNINNAIYNIKDTEARAAIDQAKQNLAETIQKQEDLLSKEKTELQEIKGDIAFQKSITLANGATISVKDNVVTFK